MPEPVNEPMKELDPEQLKKKKSGAGAAREMRQGSKPLTNYTALQPCSTECSEIDNFDKKCIFYIAFLLISGRAGGWGGGGYFGL